MCTPITLMQMEVFRTVVETGNTVKAAQKLYSSQSSISKTLSRLEENVNCPLFLRQRGKIQLTHAGEAFYASVSRILDDLDASVVEAQRVYANTETHFHIAGSGYLLRDLVRDFTESHPSNNFNLQLYSERYLAQLLSNREVDLILSTQPESYAVSGMEWVPLMDCEILLVIPKSHPLAQKENLTFQDIRYEAFICNNIGINGDFIRTMFKANGVHLDNLLECNENNVFEEYIDRSQRLTFLPAYALRGEGKKDNVVERRLNGLDGTSFSQSFGFAYRKGDTLPPVLSNFVDHAVDYCASLSRQTQELVLKVS